MTAEGCRIGITRSIEFYRGIDSGSSKMCVEFGFDDIRCSPGIKTPTIGGEYDTVENTAYSASVCSLDVFLGIKGTLSPTAFKPKAGCDGCTGECNVAVRGLTEYKTGTKVLVMRATNPDGVEVHSTGELNKGSVVTPTTTNMVWSVAGT